MASSGGPPSSYRTEILVALLGSLPLALVFAVKVVVFPRPYWVRYYDPENIYFYGGRRLLEGHLPINLDNPGMPAHYLSAAIQAVLGSDPFSIDGYRLAFWIAALLLSMLGAWILVRSVLKELPLELRLVGLWLGLLPVVRYTYATIASPEALVPLFAAIALAAIWRVATSGFDLFQILLAGFAVGLCVTLKFTFLAWLVALGAWVVLRSNCGWRRRLVALSLAVAGAQFGFVAGSFPAARKYWEMALWIRGLVSRSGRYATGEVAVPAPGELTSRLMHGLMEDPIWLAVLVAIAALSLTEVGWASARDTPAREGAVFAGIVLGATLLTTARHFAPHYLLPLGGVGCLCVRSFGARIAGPDRAGLRRILAATVLALVGVQAVRDVDHERRRNASWQDRRRAVESNVATLAAELGRPPIVVHGFASPALSFALRPMASDPSVDRELAARFPTEGFIDMGGTVVLPHGATAWDLAVLWEEGARRLEGAGIVERARFDDLLLLERREGRSGVAASGESHGPEAIR